jgi:CHAT domain-containing protein
MGNAYADLPTGDQEANLAKAISCYTEALRFLTAEADPVGYAVTQDNLGDAYLKLLTSDREANLAEAISCYTEALRFRTAETAPLHYAGIHAGLGSAYAQLQGGDREANLAKAISCYTEALRFLTAEAARAVYAAIQAGLGYTYAQLQGGDREANLAKAISCYTEALRFLTAEADPAGYRGTARGLGAVYFEQGRWAEAHTAYSSAIRAGELLYHAIGSEAGRQAELGEAGDTVADDAYCLARLGRLAEAIERLEAGRARALGEALARDRAALQRASEVDRVAFVTTADRIRALLAEGRRGQDVKGPAVEKQSFADRSAELIRAREDLAGVVQRIREYLPGFGGEGLDYSEIAATASPARPLVYLLVTSRGGLALLALARSQAAAPEHALWLDGFTAEQLVELLVQRHPSGEDFSGYLIGQLTGDPDQLAAAVSKNLEILRCELLGPLAGRLAELGVAAATIVSAGRLSLLPLSAAAPEGCIIALTPSARALWAASNALRERTEKEPVLLAVGNPLPLPAGWDALDYAGVEVHAIEQLFAGGSRRILPEEAATKKAVTQGLPGTTHLHLACHGGFDPDEPLDSALYLAGKDRLTLRDLLDGNLDLSGQKLAVLSACQTGITEFERVPDEVIGLPAGFMQAGIPGVVATLWPVNDQSTAVVVAEFYRLLLTERQDTATALDQARRHLRDATARDLAKWFERLYDYSGGTDLAAYEAAADLRSRFHPADRPYAHPVYWAGFVYYGP